MENSVQTLAAGTRPNDNSSAHASAHAGGVAVSHGLEQPEATSSINPFHPDPVASSAAQAADAPRALVNAQIEADPNTPKLTKWIHRNREWVNGTVGGEFLYQFIRSAAASIPYGIGMAVSGHLVSRGEKWATGKNYSGNEVGPIRQKIGGLLTLKEMVFFKPAIMIGVSFTMYRGVSKWMRALKEYLFDKDDDLARTNEKVKLFGEYAWEKAREIAPAEVHSTPIAAATLGAVEQLYDIGRHVGKSSIEPQYLPTTQNKMKDYLHPTKSGLLRQGLLRMFSYSFFFEAGDRRYDLYQAQKFGEKGPKSQVLEKVNSVAPSLVDRDTVDYTAPLRRGDNVREKMALNPDGSNPNGYMGWLNNNLGMGRFVFHRLLPDFVALTGYTLLKRATQAQPWCGTFNAGNNPGGWKDVPMQSLREGIGTTQFWIVPFVVENSSKMLDGAASWVKSKFNDAQQEHIAKNQADLLNQLDKKIAEKGRAT